MKLGISFGHGIEPIGIVAASAIVEKSGYDYLWVSESTGFDALSVLGAVAVKTGKIKIGSGIVNVYSRSAVQLAMAAATLDELSNGRFTLGIGASSKGVVSNWHGVPFGDQLEKVSESIRILRQKLSAQKEGSPNDSPPGSSKKKIPILLAAVGERMTRLAMSEADGVLFFMRPHSVIKEQVPALASVGKKICVSVVSCASSDPRVAESKVRRTVAFYLTFGDSYRRFIESHDSRPELDLVRREWLKGKRDEAGSLIPIDLLRDVAIFGTPQECARVIEDEYRPINGLSVLALQFNPGERSEEASLSAFSRIHHK